MKFDATAKPPLEAFSNRFFLVGYFPSYAAALYILILVWAGAPADRVSFWRAWQTATQLGVGEAILIFVAVVLAALLLQPLQLSLTRLLEGQWPVKRMREAGRKYQAWRARPLRETADQPVGVLPDGRPNPALQEAGAADAVYYRRYPQDENLIRPTALGNALTAMEAGAGDVYGWDAVVAWPRLYPLLGDRMRALVDEARDTLDMSVRLCVVTALLVPVSLGLLHESGLWLLLTLLPLAVSWTAYTGAVRAAQTYAGTVHAAFDLHRFDLITALRLPLPLSSAGEREQAKALCRMWRQGVPVDSRYAQPPQQ
ncbi:hypothetical protein [Actinomadura sp. 3N407]|uniref:hypothetical protein n=1 Tax=Actinomadura sp. 3N407 TaxID=3457423 RepID=UPI003FCC5FA2